MEQTVTGTSPPPYWKHQCLGAAVPFRHVNQSKTDALRPAQSDLLCKPSLVRDLGSQKVNVYPDKPAPKPNTVKRLDPRYWAAFPLNADWR